MRLFLLAVLALAACGDDADTSCGATGTASGSTTLLGEPFGDFHRAELFVIPPTLGNAQLALTLDESEGECGQPGTTGRRLVFAFCDAPESGDYTVISPGALRCPIETPSVSALFESADGTDLVSPASGTLTITYAGGCTTGSFELDIGGDAPFTGEFNATVCD